MSEPDGRRDRAVALVAIALLGLNLRPAANGMGAVIPEVRADLGLTATAAGVLNALPGLCFVVFGLAAPGVAARWGARRTVVAALVVMIAGQLVRIAGVEGGAGTAVVFAGSVLALAGLAVGNVLLPGLVRLIFPERIPAVTAVYTTCLLLGATAASGLTVPISRALGDWRLGLGSWVLLAAVALIPWLALLAGRHDAPPASRSGSVSIRSLLRNPVAVSLALFFAMQSMQAYVMTGWLSQILVDAGVDLAVAGSAVAVFAAAALPLATVVPALARRESHLPALIIGLGLCYVAGYAGLILRTADGFWLWAALIGAGTGAFPLVLMMITLRSRTFAGLTALSAFTQSSGYIMATVGPFVFGLLHDVSGGWTVSILMMVAAAVAMVVFGLIAARPRFVEDHQGGRP